MAIEWSALCESDSRIHSVLWLEDLNARSLLEDLGAEEGIILNWILKK
jgi:hypothetical protein